MKQELKPSLRASTPEGRAWPWATSLAVIACAAGIGAFAALQQGNGRAAPLDVSPPSAVAAVQAEAASPPAFAPRGLPDFTDLVQHTGPAVVSIETSVKARSRGAAQGMPFGGGDPMMEEFFRRFFGEGFGIPMPRAPEGGSRNEDSGRMLPSGSGSGFITSADGIVVTNAHVVQGADEVTVKLTDRREFKAKVLGQDERTDIAVLKIEAKGLPFIRTGDVNSLRVGEWVIAIGAPFGLENTVTAGIVSAKQRDTGQFVRFIQTDVAINPGNSGGPLINMRGEVVGVNSQILSGSGGYMGVSLSIPIDEAMKVAEQLRSTGTVQRGFLGVNVGDVDEAAAEALKLKKGEGAAITRVMPGSPAEQGGLKAGDIVLQFNGHKIEGSRDLQRRASSSKPGDKNSVEVLRSGERRKLSIVTGSEQSLQAAASAASGQGADAAAGSLDIAPLGLKLSPADSATLQALGLRSGLRVDAVSGSAQQAGLQAGDILLELGNVELQNLAQAQAVAAKLPSKGVVGVLYRRGEWVTRTGLRLR